MCQSDSINELTSPSTLLTLDEWKSVSKEISYKIYAENYNMLHQNNQLLNKIMLFLKTHLESRPPANGSARLCQPSGLHVADMEVQNKGFGVFWLVILML